MPATVFCRKFQRQLPALARPPFPGPDGEALQQQVSQQAWDEWLVNQTKLINEYQLNPLDPATRSYLKQQRALFLNNQSTTPFQPDAQ